MRKSILTLCALATIIISCNSKKENQDEIVKKETIQTASPLTKADSIVNAAIEAHGGNKYNIADYTFEFRDKKYHFKNDGNKYEYSSEVQKGDSLVKDVMINNDFSRYTNSKKLNLSPEETAKYGESLNSVIYFATLPYKLQDASVNKEFIEEITIKGKRYDVIKVTFGQKGGGKDFDDKYMYWINKDTYKIDYLAYSYEVNDGGVRFRTAFNTRVIAGITFQDYVNYEAPLKTPLKDLPALYEQGKLKEVSQILTENVVNNRK